MISMSPVYHTTYLHSPSSISSIVYHIEKPWWPRISTSTLHHSDLPLSVYLFPFNLSLLMDIFPFPLPQFAAYPVLIPVYLLQYEFNFISKNHHLTLIVEAYGPDVCFFFRKPLPRLLFVRVCLKQNNLGQRLVGTFWSEIQTKERDLSESGSMAG